ncbi:hypothetical protein JCM8547_000069 [Rhodosporidiobolus lusitaniae]
MPMPPAFFLDPAGPPTFEATGYKFGDDVWQEVAEREYVGYSSMGMIRASTTALTPLSEQPPSLSPDGMSRGYDAFSPSSLATSSSAAGDYKIPGQFQRYKDSPAGTPKEEKGTGKGGDWLEAMRRKEGGEEEDMEVKGAKREEDYGERESDY